MKVNIPNTVINTQLREAGETPLELRRVKQRQTERELYITDNRGLLGDFKSRGMGLDAVKCLSSIECVCVCVLNLCGPAAHSSLILHRNNSRTDSGWKHTAKQPHYTHITVHTHTHTSYTCIFNMYDDLIVVVCSLVDGKDH